LELAPGAPGRIFWEEIQFTLEGIFQEMDQNEHAFF